MSTFAKRAAVGLLLLLFLFWVFGLYRQYSSYKDVIHRNAGMVIKVGVDTWLEKVAFNAISNPAYYLKNRKKKKGPSQQRDRDRGFYLPANLFIFNLDNDPFTFYTKLKLTDQTAFKSFLKERLHVNHYAERDGITIGKSSSDPRLQLAYGHESAILSFAMNGQDRSIQLCEILDDGNAFMDTSDKRIVFLKSMQADISVLHKKGQGYLNFNNGNIEIRAELDTLQHWEVPKKIRYYESTGPDRLHLWLAGKWTGPPLGLLRIREEFVPLDSLLSLSDGYYELRVQGNTLQKDTIIEYGYNEDFEKTEMRTLKERTVPATSLLLEGDADRMLKLLNAHGTVRKGYLSPDLFPMLQLRANTTERTGFILENEHMGRRAKPSSEFFQLRANMEQLIRENKIPSLPPMLEKLDRVRFGASKNGKTISLKGEIVLHEREINALAYLLMGAVKDHGDK